MTRRAVTLDVAGFVAALLIAAPSAMGQSLLVIPDMGAAEATKFTPGASARMKCDTTNHVRLIGSMNADQSECFWGESRASVLPGVTFGFGSDRGAIYTELGKVLSGPWRVSVGTVLAVANDDAKAPADTDSEELSSGFARFVAGGGNLSLQGSRAIITAKSAYNGAVLLFAPRGWLNVPQLSSATGITDYGGEAAVSLLLQRRDNKNKPFLAFELRSGIVAGSDDFYETVGRISNKPFTYLAPTLTFALQDQVNIAVSSFTSSAFEGEPAVTLKLTLVNKNPANQQSARNLESSTSPDAARLVVLADSFAIALRHQEASTHYARVLQLWPDSMQIAQRALGSFWRAGRSDDAYTWGRRALAREPQSLDILFDLGVSCGFLIELDCAESTFRQALVIDSMFVDGYGELAFLAQARGDLPVAIRHMERARALAPQNDFAVSGLAQMLIPAGDAGRARAVMEPRLAANRKARAYGGRSMLTLYGWALLRDGQAIAAHAVFNEVLGWLAEREAAGQTTYQLYRERAAIHALRGERDATIKAMRTAYDRGWRLYASWSLADPMFSSVISDPAVTALLERMRADVRAMRQRLGMSSGL